MNLDYRPSNGRYTRCDAWISQCREGLEGVLFVMARDTSHHFHWSMFGITIDSLQLLAYPLYSGSSFPWSKSKLLSGVANQFLKNLNPSYAADAVSVGCKLSLVFLSSAWVAAIIAAVVYSAYSFSRGNFTSILPLRFLRATARLTSAVLFMPLTTLLISVYKCSGGGTWAGSSIVCYGLEHSLLLSLVTLLLPFFFGFSICVAAVFIDRDCRSHNIIARAHGHVSICMISIKTLVTLTFSVAPDLPALLLQSFLISMGVLWMWVWLKYLPQYSQWVNQLWTSVGAVFLWCSACAMLGTLVGKGGGGEEAAYVLLLGSPAAAYCGYALCVQRFHSFSSAGERQGIALHTPYDVELRARYLLKDFSYGYTSQPPDSKGVASGAADEAEDGRAIASGIHDDSHSNPDHRETTTEDSTAALSSSSSSSLWSLPPHAHKLHSSSSLTQAEINAAVHKVDKVYRRALRTFPQSAAINLFYAEFRRCFLPCPSEELELILEGLSKEPAIDVRFLLFQSKKSLEGSKKGGVVEGAAGSSTTIPSSSKEMGVGADCHSGGGGAVVYGGEEPLGVIEQVQYDKLEKCVREGLVRARGAELKFWAELRRPVVRLGTLQTVTGVLSQAVCDVEGAFKESMNLKPGHSALMHQYADFLRDVKRSRVEAEAVRREALDIEVKNGARMDSDGENLQVLEFERDGVQEEEEKEEEGGGGALVLTGGRYLSKKSESALRSPSTPLSSSSSSSMGGAQEARNTSTLYLAADLVRSVIADLGKVREPSLRRLTYAVALFFLAAVTLFSTRATLFYLSLTSYRSLTSTVAQAAARNFMLEVSLQHLLALNQATLTGQRIQDAPLLPEASIISTLTSLSSELRSQNRALSSQASGQDTDSQEWELYNTPRFTVDDFICSPGNNNNNNNNNKSVTLGGSHNSSLGSLSIEWVNTLTVFLSHWGLNTPLNNSCTRGFTPITSVSTVPTPSSVYNATLAPHDPLLSYLLYNGQTSLRRGFDSSVDLLATRTRRSLKELIEMEWRLFWAALVTFLALPLFTFLPLLSTVSSASERMFSVFLELPDWVLKDMQEVTDSALDELVQKGKIDGSQETHSSRLSLSHSSSFQSNTLSLYPSSVTRGKRGFQEMTSRSSNSQSTLHSQSSRTPGPQQGGRQRNPPLQLSHPRSPPKTPGACSTPGKSQRLSLNHTAPPPVLVVGEAKRRIEGTGNPEIEIGIRPSLCAAATTTTSTTILESNSKRLPRVDSRLSILSQLDSAHERGELIRKLSMSMLEGGGARMMAAREGGTSGRRKKERSGEITNVSGLELRGVLSVAATSALSLLSLLSGRSSKRSGFGGGGGYKKNSNASGYLRVPSLEEKEECEPSLPSSSSPSFVNAAVMPSHSVNSLENRSRGLQQASQKMKTPAPATATATATATTTGRFPGVLSVPPTHSYIPGHKTSFSGGEDGGVAAPSTTTTPHLPQPPSHRLTKSSLLHSCQYLVRFFLPLLLLLLLLFGSLAYTLESLTKAEDLHTAALGYHSLRVKVMRVGWLVESTLSDVSAACSVNSMASLEEGLRVLTGKTRSLCDSLVLGDASAGIPSPERLGLPALRSLLLSDGCHGVGEPGCRSFFYGLLGTQGQHAVSLTFLTMASQVVEARRRELTVVIGNSSPSAAGLGGPCPALPVLFPASSSPLAVLERMGHTFLPASLEVGGKIITSFFTQHLLLLHLFHALFCLGITAAVACTVAWQRARIRNWDDEIKRARGMLLLFPTDVLAGVARFINPDTTTTTLEVMEVMIVADNDDHHPGGDDSS